MLAVARGGSFCASAVVMKTSTIGSGCPPSSYLMNEIAASGALFYMSMKQILIDLHSLKPVLVCLSSNRGQLGYSVQDPRQGKP